MQNDKFNTLIQKLCEELDIKTEKLSYGWILQLTKNGKVRHIVRNHFDLNSQSAGDIADDKYATYEVLNSQKIPVIKHYMLFNPKIRKEYTSDEQIQSNIISLCEKYNTLVVKPNNEYEGIGVSLCHTMHEVKDAVEKLFKTHNSVSICPFYSISTEYRAFLLNGKVHLIYGKTKPFVIGDGKSNIRELIKKLDFPQNGIVENNIGKINLKYVPQQNEKVEISWKHNLSGGATPKILEKGELYTKIENLAIQAGKALNINFATIDIIQTTDNELLVLEINAGVGSTIFMEKVDNGYEIIKEIYKQALEALF